MIGAAFGQEPVVVAMQDAFKVGGEMLMYPGDPSGSPWNTIQCRCTTLPVIVMGDPPPIPPTVEEVAVPAKPKPQPKPRAPRRRGNYQPYPKEGFAHVHEIEDWGRKSYPKIKWDLSGITHTENLNPFIRRFDELAQRYPEMAKRLDYFGTYGDHTGVGFTRFSGSYAWEESPKAWAHHWEYPGGRGRSLFGINPQYFNQRGWAREVAKTSLPKWQGQMPWHPAGCNTIESVMTHEWGHLAEAWFSHVRNYDWAVVDVVDSRTGMGKIGQMGTEFIRTNKATAELSRYAATSPHTEGWAEGFAQMHHAPESQWNSYTRKVKALTDQILDESKWNKKPQALINLSGEELERWTQRLEELAAETFLDSFDVRRGIIVSRRRD